MRTMQPASYGSATGPGRDLVPDEHVAEGGLPAVQLDLEEEVALAVPPDLVDKRPVNLDRDVSAGSPATSFGR